MTNKTIKLHEIVAVRKGIKSRTYGELTQMHHAKPGPFNGFSKDFVPVNAEGETYPPESQRVQLVAEDMLKRVAQLRTEFYDAELTQDCGNQRATADIVVDGQVIWADVPVTMLITLEKDLADLRTFISELPTLDESKDWEDDPNSKLFRTQPVVTHKTKKIQRGIVLQAPTKEHPAQTQLISEDVIVGHWHTVHRSGALPTPRREQLLERVNKLRDAVKQARARANNTEVERKEIGSALFAYMLG